MKKLLLFLFLLITCTFYSNAQGIFDDSIHTATNFGSVNSPAPEGAQNIIDQNSATKFLDFDAFDGIGFEVDLLGVSKTAISMEFVTANDAQERDPTDYEISGSNDGMSYTSITIGTIPCIPTRLFSRTFSFANITTYTYYRVNFTGTCGTSSINQIADVQLFESIGDSPVITCPANITMNNTTGQCGTVINYNVTATDTEDGTLTPTVTSGLASGASFPVGDTEVFMSVTDTDTNTVSCSFTVTVVDAENPVSGCIADITETAANVGDTTAVVNYTLNPSDNCVLINPLANFTPLTTINGKAYYLSDNSFTPQDAFTDAIAQGGFVGTIRNSAENTLITEAVNTVGGAGDLLIGYNDEATEGSFVWQSGDAATYNNWNPGEPNNAGNEDYTVSQSSGGWNDVTNGNTYRYLLEVNYTPTQTAGLASGSDFPIGTTTNTFQIIDLAGNSVMCSFNVTVNAALSVSENELSQNISLAPNPAENNITIESPNNSVINIKVFDLHGRQVIFVNEINSDNYSLDISQLVTSIYLVKIKTVNGSVIKRIVKK